MILIVLKEGFLGDSQVVLVLKEGFLGDSHFSEGRFPW